MPIRVMKVVKADQHSNADRLRVYIFENGAGEHLQIVANLENVYEIGDHAAIACVGTVLSDGTEIKLAKPRGVESFGMALGKVSEEVDTDLTEKYGAK